MIVSFEEGAGLDRELLGLKGSSLCDMESLKLPVPPGFILTTDASRAVADNGGRLPDDLWNGVMDHVRGLERATERKFADPARPLLLSVRSGSNVLMPGMMDTVLNVGMNDAVVEGLAREYANEWFAYDCYRRFIQMYGEIVLRVERRFFQTLVRDTLNTVNVDPEDADVTFDTTMLKKLTAGMKEMVAQKGRAPIPDEPEEQLRTAIESVFASWSNPRAVTYRRLYRISSDHGTAVMIQYMVFGNINERSATGTMNSRDPATGEKKFYGEFNVHAQGEETLLDSRPPLSLRRMPEIMPGLYEDLKRAAELLERHFCDVQEIEFTVQDGRLYLLQTRRSPRTAMAAIKLAVDMTGEGLISREEAILRVRADTLDQLLHQTIDPNVHVRSIARGLPASPGAATGAVVLDVDGAERARERKEDVILVRDETTTEDVRGLSAAAGVLTSRGGRTSHAAVVARGMGRPCVAGCEAVAINMGAREFTVGEITVREGDIITIDGSTGRVFLGAVPLKERKLTEEFRTLLGWCDHIRSMHVRANSDSPDDAALAIEFGAEGIGLCRTEQMFQAADRLPVMRAMILSHTERERRDQLKKLSEMQQQDFMDIFWVMDGRPVTFRLLDLPLHEFLTPLDTLLMEVATLRAQSARGREMEIKEELLSKVLQLKEANPMLGLRGCRLGIMFPEINQMQLQAIFEAACRVLKRKRQVKPEIMIPLVGHVNEIKIVREQVDSIAAEVMKRNDCNFEYRFGALIEIPRAALTAAKIAEYCDFFSFGTNDMTQTTFGLSRDDAERKFLLHYLDHGILEKNPFETIDLEGVGRLIELAVRDGRGVRNELVTGLCGEQAGDWDSIKFCHNTGIDYVSCSTYRVPIARLSAAQVRILEMQAENKGA